MYLQRLIVINYQSCQKIELEFSKDDPTVLIGINDSGKSSILKAIDLLFDGKTQFNFLKEDKVRCDISNTKLTEAEFQSIFSTNNLPTPLYDGNQTVLLGKIKIEDDDLIGGFEENVSTHLIWALENAVDNVLWIMKVFCGSDYSTKDFLLANDKDGDHLELWGSKATELKQLRKDYAVTDEEIENENKTGRYKNIELIRALYKKQNLQFCWSEYKEKKKDKSFFIEISYLDWNFSFDELISFTNTIMSQTISANLNEAKTYANEKAKEAQEIVNKDLDEIIEFLSGEIPTIKKIKSNVIFNIQSRITDLVINKVNTDKDIHLESQGDGVKRQIWFAMIKWKAKKTLENKKTAKKLIWCFDEPETHLYPAAQRDFLNKIKTVSKGNVQTIISTHSTIFVDRVNLLQINKILLENGYTIPSKCKSVDEVFESLNLKNSDFLFYDKFLIIEGDTEKYLIPKLYSMLTGRKLENDNIQLITISGKDKWVERKKALNSIFSDFRKPDDSIFFLFDKDMSFEIGNAVISANMHFIGKQDIEDSIKYPVWERIVKDITQNEIQLIEKEFDQLIKSISGNKKINKEEKFIPKLEKLLKEKLSKKRSEEITWDILPSKGKDLSDIIIKHMDSLNNIDETIENIFNKLQGN